MCLRRAGERIGNQSNIFLAVEDNYSHIYEIPPRGWNIRNVVNDTIFSIRKNCTKHANGVLLQLILITTMST